MIGFRDPESGAQRINPPDATEVPADAQVVYLADAPKLEA